MKLVWSPETASKAYIDTVKSCESIKESGVAELLSAMAAGWNSKLIVETWAHGGPITASVGLALAASHTCGRHVCVVPDERSRLAYVKAMQDVFGGGGDGDVSAATEVIVREAAAEVIGELNGVDFLVVDCKRKDLARVLRVAMFSKNGAVLACKNARRWRSGFLWQGVMPQMGTRVVRSVFLPVGQGLDIVHIGSSGGVGGGESLQKKKKNHSRWIKHVDQISGEEHVFRGKF